MMGVRQQLIAVASAAAIGLTILQPPSGVAAEEEQQSSTPPASQIAQPTQDAGGRLKKGDIVIKGKDISIN
jgi:hypothetical protein